MRFRAAAGSLQAVVLCARLRLLLLRLLHLLHPAAAHLPAAPNVIIMLCHSMLHVQLHTSHHASGQLICSAPCAKA